MIINAVCKIPTRNCIICRNNREIFDAFFAILSFILSAKHKELTVAKLSPNLLRVTIASLSSHLISHLRT